MLDRAMLVGAMLVMLLHAMLLHAMLSAGSCDIVRASPPRTPDLRRERSIAASRPGTP